MTSSILTHMRIFIASIFLLSLGIPNVVATTPSPSLLKQACNNASYTMDTDLCIQILQSEPKIASAANLFDLSIAIMEVGVSNATGTHSYIESRLKEANLEPGLKGSLQLCNSSYIWAIASLSSALGEIREIKEYQTATYDLAIATSDAINPCNKALDSEKINDEVILRGNTALDIFGLSANIVVDVLYGESLKP